MVSTTVEDLLVKASDKLVKSTRGKWHFVSTQDICFSLIGNLEIVHNVEYLSFCNTSCLCECEVISVHWKEKDKITASQLLSMGRTWERQSPIIRSWIKSYLLTPAFNFLMNKMPKYELYSFGFQHLKTKVETCQLIMNLERVCECVCVPWRLCNVRQWVCEWVFDRRWSKERYSSNRFHLLSPKKDEAHWDMQSN